MAFITLLVQWVALSRSLTTDNAVSTRIGDRLLDFVSYNTHHLLATSSTHNSSKSPSTTVVYATTPLHLLSSTITFRLLRGFNEIFLFERNGQTILENLLFCVYQHLNIACFLCLNNFYFVYFPFCQLIFRPLPFRLLQCHTLKHFVHLGSTVPLCEKDELSWTFLCDRKPIFFVPDKQM